MYQNMDKIKSFSMLCNLILGITKVEYWKSWLISEEGYCSTKQSYAYWLLDDLSWKIIADLANGELLGVPLDHIKKLGGVMENSLMVVYHLIGHLWHIVTPS